MRTVFAYWLAEACGPMAYCEPEHFVNAKVHAQTMEAFDKEVNRAKRDQVPCACHNLRKYGKLPVWAAVEVMTMGQLSYLYGNLCNCAEKPLEERAVKKMAQEFGLRPAVLKSWLQHLCAVRNTCGHHGRFYNRVMRIRPKMLARERQWAGNKEFPTFLVLKDIYEVVWPELWTNKAAELAAIVARHSGVDLRPMGFPEDWQDVLGVPLLEESTNGV